jgi:hypothetical protein
MNTHPFSDPIQILSALAPAEKAASAAQAETSAASEGHDAFALVLDESPSPKAGQEARAKSGQTGSAAASKDPKAPKASATAAQDGAARTSAPNRGALTSSALEALWALDAAPADGSSDPASAQAASSPEAKTEDEGEVDPAGIGLATLLTDRGAEAALLAPAAAAGLVPGATATRGPEAVAPSEAPPMAETRADDSGKQAETGRRSAAGRGGQYGSFPQVWALAGSTAPESAAPAASQDAAATAALSPADTPILPSPQTPESQVAASPSQAGQPGTAQRPGASAQTAKEDATGRTTGVSSAAAAAAPVAAAASAVPAASYGGVSGSAAFVTTTVAEAVPQAAVAAAASAAAAPAAAKPASSPKSDAPARVSAQTDRASDIAASTGTTVSTAPEPPVAQSKSADTALAQMRQASSQMPDGAATVESPARYSLAESRVQAALTSGAAEAAPEVRTAQIAAQPPDRQDPATAEPAAEDTAAAPRSAAEASLAAKPAAEGATGQTETAPADSTRTVSARDTSPRARAQRNAERSEPAAASSAAASRAEPRSPEPDTGTFVAPLSTAPPAPTATDGSTSLSSLAVSDRPTATVGLETAGSATSHLRAASPHALAHQLAQAFSTNGTRPVEVTLSPEELGKVRMTLHTTDSSITVSLQAERPETLDLMRRNIDSLARDFRDLGYSNISFDFGQQAEQQQPPQEQTALPDLPERETPLRFETSSIAIQTPAQTETGGLDLRM